MPKNLEQRIKNLEQLAGPAVELPLSEGEKIFANLFGEGFILEGRRHGFILDNFAACTKFYYTMLEQGELFKT